MPLTPVLYFISILESITIIIPHLKIIYSISLFTSFIICLLIALGLVGCNKITKTNPYEGKTIINFGCYDGGWGREWLDKAIEKFEEMYPEYHVVVDYNKSYTGSTLYGKIDVIPQDIYYTTVNLYDYL